MGVSAAPADIAAHVFSDVLVRTGVTLTNTGNGGHDLTRGAIAALEGIVLDERGLDYVQHPVGSFEASIVVTWRPSTWAARVRQLNTRSPSTWTVEAPH